MRRNLKEARQNAGMTQKGVTKYETSSFLYTSKNVRRNA